MVEMFRHLTGNLKDKQILPTYVTYKLKTIFPHFLSLLHSIICDISLIVICFSNYILVLNLSRLENIVLMLKSTNSNAHHTKKTQKKLLNYIAVFISLLLLNFTKGEYISGHIFCHFF